MPGSMFDLECSGCGKVHSIHTGADLCHEHRAPWSYEQFVCETCQLLASRRETSCTHREPLTCEDCGSQLVPWSGRVLLEKQRDGMSGPEHVAGPCPACGAELTEQHSQMIGLWD
jgi:hypothetical protein